MLQGEVKILTGGIVRKHAWRADKVQFLDRRYSPDGRSDIMLKLCYALEGVFFVPWQISKDYAEGEKWAKTMMLTSRSMRFQSRV